jgi:hypothetical protein
VLAWAAVYLAIVTAAVAIVLARREPTIVRGDWVFFLTSLFVLLAATATAWRGTRVSLGALVATVLLLVAGWYAQSRWWVIGVRPDAVTTTIEECAGRLCAPAATASGACTVTVPGGSIRLRIAPAGRSTVIVFIASAKHRKAHLFRRLLAKQYRSVMPTIRIGAPRAG